MPGRSLRRGVALASLALTACLPFTGAAQAQDWFTPEACRIGEIRVWPDILPAELEERLDTIAAEVPNSLGKFWQITAPGGEVSHLWGTFHVPDREILDLPEAFRAVLDQADIVALEFDPLPESRAAVLRGYDQAWMWRSPGSDGPNWHDPDLRDDFPPLYLDYIAQRIATFGWPRDFLPQLTDAAVLSLLLADPCSDFLAPLVPGQDYYIAQTAWLAGAGVTGLQPPWALGEDLNAPHRAGAARAAALLYALSLGPQSAAPHLRETGYALYLQGRIGTLDAWSEEWPLAVLGAARGREVIDLAEGYLLVERNAIWMERIRALADQGGAVIAVGASHLPGDLGLVTLLRDAGYQVERIVLPGERPGG